MPPITEIVSNCLCGVCLALSALTSTRLCTRSLPIADNVASIAARRLVGASLRLWRRLSVASLAALPSAMRASGQARRGCLLKCGRLHHNPTGRQTNGRRRLSRLRTGTRPKSPSLHPKGRVSSRTRQGRTGKSQDRSRSSSSQSSLSAFC